MLEVVGPPTFLDDWCGRLGLARPELDAALARVDPLGLAETGGLTEADLRRGYAAALGLTSEPADLFMADLWDWYCGQPDDALVSWVRGLRPRVRTAILSNSADGARREEERRYRFSELVDAVVYSHEVGLAKPDPAVFALTCARLGVGLEEAVLVDDVVANVEAAGRLGMPAVLHRDTAGTLAAVERLLAAGPKRPAASLPG